jgi:hypothetical protein
VQELLLEVGRLGVAIGVPGDVGYTCETAAYFHRHHIAPRVRAFRDAFGLPAPPDGGVTGSAWSGDGGPEAATAPATAAALSSPAELAAAQRLAYHAAVRQRVAHAALTAAAVRAAFPFGPFFATAPGGLDGLFPAEQ